MSIDASRDPRRRARRWTALAVIFISFLPFTLNWFAIVPAFGALAAELHLGLSQITLIVGAFMAGYGLAHVPGGLLAGACGVRFSLLIGMAIETGGATLSAYAPDYGTLLLARGLCGIGGSIYLGSAIGLATAWFRGRELVTAIALLTGVAFTLGAAAGLFAWGPMVARMGWRDALLIGAAIGLALTMFMLLLFPHPPGDAGEEIRGGHITSASLLRVFGNANLWLLGFSFLGAYGTYFTAAQLLPNYAENHLGLNAHVAAGLGIILLLGGIPSAFISGWLARPRAGMISLFFVACLVEGATTLLIPLLDSGAAIVLATIMLGLAASVAFLIWIALPALYTDTLAISDIPAAAGLLLTIGAVGGVACPWIYGRATELWGYGAGWLVQGALTFAFALLALMVRQPAPAASAG